jgi:hypothetical protein
VALPIPRPQPRRSVMSRIHIPVDVSRRKFLILFGLAYVGIGYSFIGAGPTAPARMALAWNEVPFWLFGLMWMGCGVVGMIASFVPTTRDKPGFLCLSVPPVVWSLGYLVAYLFQRLDHYDAPPRALVSVVVFAVVALAVDTVSGMVDARLAAKHETRSELDL